MAAYRIERLTGTLYWQRVTGQKSHNYFFGPWMLGVLPLFGLEQMHAVVGNDKNEPRAGDDGTHP